MGSKGFLWTVIVLLSLGVGIQTFRVQQVQEEAATKMQQAFFICQAMSQKIGEQQGYIEALENYVKENVTPPEIQIDEAEPETEGITVPEDGELLQGDERGSGPGIGAERSDVTGRVPGIRTGAG